MSAANATRHPDDPRPLNEQFDRTYPTAVVGLSWSGCMAIQHPNGWRPARWHRPEPEWWDGDTPLALRSDTPTWTTLRPNQRRGAA